MPSKPLDEQPSAVALVMVQAMEREADAAIRYRNRPAGGQQVSFHGDFVNANVPTLVKIKWWAREIRRCLGDNRRDLPED